MHVKVVRLDSNKRRLVVRRVDEYALAERARSKVIDDLGFAVDHGGGVANCYGYPAETEVALAISNGLLTVVYISRASARNVTLHKAANTCVQYSGALWHRGNVSELRLDAARNALRAAFNEEFTSIEQLAAASA